MVSGAFPCVSPSKPLIGVCGNFDELDAGLCVAIDREPSPPSAQLTSIPRLMLQSQTSANTGVLIRTLSTGKMSGRRAGGEIKSSAI